MEFSKVVLVILGCLVLSGWIAALVIARKKKSADKQVAVITSALEERDHKISQLDAALERLSKYQAIEDAGLEAERIVFEAKKKAGQLWQDAERESKSHLKAAFSRKENAEFEAANIKQNADEKRSQIIAEARREASEIRDKVRLSESKSQSLIQEAHARAEKIISHARIQAEETAGNALKAVENAKLYEQTAKAMKNVIEGYHDDYIIPNASLLDDLAEDFSHKDAGQKLKQSRKHSADMAKNGRAGGCDYVEKTRREYAIHFAVDAFNGKVDSILSKVKHDNYGKLKQGILDAFALVNHNGQPFKNARITDLYLQARLEELKWAVATMELKRIEQEEQREIREQMREEEKARRDIEKALKQAEKEEKMLAKAMTEARKQLESASDAEREGYKARLAELELQLQESEARGQRAISMAQQTRRGHVYVISNIGSFGENVFKIGMTRRLEPLDRVKELGDASVPFSFDVHAMIYSDDAPSLERELHRRFASRQVNRLNARKEFFQVPISEVREVVDSQQAEVHWTMAAEAWEYRESLALAGKQLQAVS
ncbi:DUF4041 domain-containing protein [Vreelandella zhanjiangensis]|uniref:DUF4041 domain-containing protein n=1 Tax=Vreelandella zhanjiangensis TaxID=1121960 RepID=UPI000379164A|nr:DUF4041 domain-containing protein [Halomonas zhanjiangensis]